MATASIAASARFGALPLARPRGAPDIAEGIPALQEGKDSASIVAQADIGRAPGFRRASGKLERALVSRPATEPQGELLNGEVAGVGSVLDAVPFETDDQRAPGRECDSLPRVKRVATTEAALDRALRGSRNPGVVGDLLLRHAPAPARGAHLTTEPSKLLEVAPVRLRSEFRGLDLRHDRCMVAPSAWLWLMPAFGTLRAGRGGPVTLAGRALQLEGAHARAESDLVADLSPWPVLTVSMERSRIRLRPAEDVSAGPGELGRHGFLRPAEGVSAGPGERGGPARAENQTARADARASVAVRRAANQRARADGPGSCVAEGVD
ncbi:MAG TPA: hypothetical protein VMQ65_07570 [Candidatus Limnocylindria bacterium]|nr:hypothetical protein [Candidatus Limnocylindria bacterium]